MQNACAILWRHLWPVAPPDLSTLCHKRQDFRKKMLLIIKCVFWFFLQVLSEMLLILRITQRDGIINVHTSSWEEPVCSCQTSVELEFSGQISEKRWNTKFNKNPCWRTGGRTDVVKLIVAFRNFAKAARNVNIKTITKFALLVQIGYDLIGKDARAVCSACRHSNLSLSGLPCYRTSRMTSIRSKWTIHHIHGCPS
jgi:hypothetical protein